MKKNNNKILAFTLVEILIAVSVIGIISTTAVVLLNTGRAGSRDTKRLADINRIQTALRMYYNDYKAYPTTAEWGTKLATGSNVYLEKIPVAPQTSEGDCGASSSSYIYESDGSTYTLKFCLGTKVGDYVAGFKEATPDGIIATSAPGPSCLALAEYQATTSSRLILHLNGDSNDSTTNTNNGTNTSISYTNTEMNQSASFNGTSSKIDFGQKTSLNNVGTSNYIISLWIKPNADMNTDRTIIRNWSLVEPKRQWNLSWTSAGKIVHYLYYTSSTWLLLQSNSTLTTGVWHNIVATRVSGTVYLYVDGVLQASGSRSQDLSNASNYTTLGYAYPENGYYFSGLIDEVIVEYGRGWTAGEVSAYYQTIAPRISCLNE